MKRLRVRELKEGMIIAADVFESTTGAGLPVIRQGVTLNADYINRLMHRGIPYVLVETPAGYTGSIGETLELDLIEEDTVFQGKVVINGDVPPHIKVDAGESIIVAGSIAEGCIFTSAKGGILLKGDINGLNDGQVKITSNQNITIKGNISFADLKSSGEVIITGDVGNCSITARGEVRIEGRVTGSQIYTQSRMLIRNAGDGRNEPNLLIAKPFESRELSQELLRIDSKMFEVMKEKERLKNVIELIRKLGKDIETLSPEKKKEMAVSVKRYKEIEQENSAAQTRKAEIKQEMEQYLGIKRVIIPGVLLNPAKITIENSNYEVMSGEAGVAFYVKEHRIIKVPYVGGV